jgi:hypothetical protein
VKFQLFTSVIFVSIGRLFMTLHEIKCCCFRSLLTSWQWLYKFMTEFRPADTTVNFFPHNRHFDSNILALTVGHITDSFFSTLFWIETQRLWIENNNKSFDSKQSKWTPKLLKRKHQHSWSNLYKSFRCKE